MSYVIADPELMTSAASDLASIGSNVSAAHMVAAARTVAVIPAAADEVSAGIADLFSQHAQDYQALAGQASAFHEEFVHHLTAGAASYANIEAFIASFLHDLNVNANSLAGTIGTELIQLFTPLIDVVAGFAVIVATILFFLYVIAVLFYLAFIYGPSVAPPGDVMAAALR